MHGLGRRDVWGMWFFCMHTEPVAHFERIGWAGVGDAQLRPALAVGQEQSVPETYEQTVANLFQWPFPGELPRHSAPVFHKLPCKGVQRRLARRAHGPHLYAQRLSFLHGAYELRNRASSLRQLLVHVHRDACARGNAPDVLADFVRKICPSAGLNGCRQPLNFCVRAQEDDRLAFHLSSHGRAQEVQFGYVHFVAGTAPTMYVQRPCRSCTPLSTRASCTDGFLGQHGATHNLLDAIREAYFLIQRLPMRIGRAGQHVARAPLFRVVRILFREQVVVMEPRVRRGAARTRRARREFAMQGGAAAKAIARAAYAFRRGSPRTQL